MKYINKNLYREGKNSLCIGTDFLNINNLPTAIKGYICDALLCKEKVILLTDDVLFNDIEEKNLMDEDLIIQNINTGNFIIKAYNIDDFNCETKEFLDIINIISDFKHRFRIIWDFKNLINKDYKLEVITKCVEKIIEGSKDNGSNMVYIDDSAGNFNRLYNLCNLFETLIIIDRNKEMEFKNQDEIEKAIWMLRSNTKLKALLILEEKRFSDMQNKLIQNERLKAMGEMAAGITHDINNILTPILGSVQLLKDTIQEKENAKLLSVIEICAYDGMNITNRVKRLTKKYNDDGFQTFSIDSALKDAIDLTKSKWLTESVFKGIKIDIIKSLNSNETVKGNITEIREVFINIVANAVDAMPKGGKIEVITKNKDNNVIIEIRDNGLGMSSIIQDRIFEPFFTTKGNNGSGLGLSISYNTIISHKGSIKIESLENIGTTFSVKLPICENIIKSYDEVTSSVIHFEGNVLIIDDQEQIRNVVASMIKSISKCKIKTCGCENLDSELSRRKYDIVVCDFAMPSINGLEVAQKVKQLNKKTFFCLMTGYVGSFDGQDLNNIDFVLNKPINRDSLKQMFSDYNIKL
jgi:signal transduction histidine kinase